MSREEEKCIEELHAFQLKINEFEIRPEEEKNGCRPKETINYTEQRGQLRRVLFFDPIHLHHEQNAAECTMISASSRGWNVERRRTAELEAMGMPSGRALPNYGGSMLMGRRPRIPKSLLEWFVYHDRTKVKVGLDNLSFIVHQLTRVILLADKGAFPIGRFLLNFEIDNPFGPDFMNDLAV